MFQKIIKPENDFMTLTISFQVVLTQILGGIELLFAPSILFLLKRLFLFKTEKEESLINSFYVIAYKDVSSGHATLNKRN